MGKKLHFVVISSGEALLRHGGWSLKSPQPEEPTTQRPRQGTPREGRISRFRELQTKFLTSVQCKCFEERWSEQCTLRRTWLKFHPADVRHRSQMFICSFSCTRPQQTLKQIFATHKHQNFLILKFLKIKSHLLFMGWVSPKQSRSIYIITALVFNFKCMIQVELDPSPCSPPSSRICWSLSCFCTIPL